MNRKQIMGVLLLLCFCIIALFVVIMQNLSLISKSKSSLNTNSKATSKPLSVVTTTTMIYDLATVIGGDRIHCIGLMNVGIDPHLYQASAGDMVSLTDTDVIIYNGLHLEGKMGELLHQLESFDKSIICLEDAFESSSLLSLDEGDGSTYDPHIWFDVSLWSQAATYVADSLSQLDVSNAPYYTEQLENYLVELTQLETYILQRVDEIPIHQRILITAHDAFQYFGNAYGFQVMGLQGISTNTETSTYQIRQLADYIVEHQINSIFIESSISSKSIEALQEAVMAKGFQVRIGGTLYSDSLGDATNGHNTYLTTTKANIDTIIDGLQ